MSEIVSELIPNYVFSLQLTCSVGTELSQKQVRVKKVRNIMSDIAIGTGFQNRKRNWLTNKKTKADTQWSEMQCET